MTEKMITWQCHVCGDERPDRFISLFTRDVSEAHQLPPGTAKFNIRYCNDRLTCKTGAVAPDFKFFNGHPKASGPGEESQDGIH